MLIVLWWSFFCCLNGLLVVGVGLVVTCVMGYLVDSCYLGFIRACLSLGLGLCGSLWVLVFRFWCGWCVWVLFIACLWLLVCDFVCVLWFWLCCDVYVGTLVVVCLCLIVFVFAWLVLVLCYYIV